MHALELVSDFYRRHPGAPRHIWAADFPSLQFQPIPMSGRRHLEGGGGWMSGDTRFPTQTRYVPDPRPLYTFRPIDVDSGFPNPVRTCPLPDKPAAAERPSRLIIFILFLIRLSHYQATLLFIISAISVFRFIIPQPSRDPYPFLFGSPVR